MTSSLFNEWLSCLDVEMQNQQRNLFLDNASSHVKEIELTNIELAFIPPNTTSTLQPLDQGIIENIKVYYWKQVLSNVLSRINSNKGSPPIVLAITASVNVLDCCCWIASAV